MGIVRILYDKTGSEKYKMAASKQDLDIIRLVDEIETKFQRLILHLRGPATQRDYWEYCTIKPEVENPRWRPPISN